MRTFNDKEKEILQLIDKSNGLSFQSLIASKIIDCKLIINHETKQVRVRYKTINFSPSTEELERIREISDALFERIYLSVMLITLFIKEGYISLFRIQGQEPRIILGDYKIPEEGIINEIGDENIRNLLLEYTNKTLLVTSEFNEFVKNGFRTRDEKRQIKSLHLAWIGILTAIISSFISILLIIYSTFYMKEKEIIKFNQDFNNSITKIDSIIVELNVISSNIKESNFKLDSIAILDENIISEIRQNKTDKAKH